MGRSEHDWKPVGTYQESPNQREQQGKVRAQIPVCYQYRPTGLLTGTSVRFRDKTTPGGAPFFQNSRWEAICPCCPSMSALTSPKPPQAPRPRNPPCARLRARGKAEHPFRREASSFSNPPGGQCQHPVLWYQAAQFHMHLPQAPGLRASNYNRPDQGYLI